MAELVPLLAPPLTIAAVERDTRIGKDTLRVWERRYGFPNPDRDSNGERLYPADQVERLRHVKRLLDAGHRPGRIVSLSLDVLKGFGDLAPSPARTSAAYPEPGSDVTLLVDLLRRHELLGFRRHLTQCLLRRGLGRFVTDVALPLVHEIGTAWSRGQMDIFEEHLCSDTLETVLRAAIAGAPEADESSTPRVLSSTFPDEPHGLGLLMAEALMSVEGCWCTSLGRQTPLRDLVMAAQAFRSQIIVLSFTAVNNPNQTLEGLLELRTQLPDGIEIWAGSALPVLQRRAGPGIRLMTSMHQIAPAVAEWRKRQGDR